MSTKATTSRGRNRNASQALRLTPGGYSGISDRIVEIREQRLPELRPLLVDRERDERDVAEFERLLVEAIDLEALLAEAEIMTDDDLAFDGRIEVGMRVRVSMADGSHDWVRIVHPAEAFLDGERISQTSPLATALVGARKSDAVWVAAPSGVWSCTVLDVDPSVVDPSVIDA
jgi:transcription elongation GreA/GreB family factor